MKSCMSRALALILALVMVFTLGVPAFGAECLIHDYTGWTTTKEATCTERGELTRTCKSCDFKDTITTDFAHNYVDKEFSTDCTKGGYVRSVCTACGDIKSEFPFDGKAHTYGEPITDKETTCTQDGQFRSICTVCGVTKTETTEKYGHSYSDAITAKDPTCTESGQKKFICTICREEITEDIPALGHLSTVLDGTDATCTDDGLSDGKYCPRCDTVIEAQEKIPALGHEKVTVPRLEPTCTEKGFTESVVCKNCGHIYEEGDEIPAKGHIKVTAPAVAPTCVKPGLTEGEKCANCDYFYTPQTEIPRLNHAHDILPAVPATCTKTGLTAGKYCKICDIVAVQQNVIPPTGHSEVYYQELAPTCEDAGFKSGKRCSVCGITVSGLEVIPPLGHTEEIFTAVPATCTSTGMSEGRVCRVCKKVTKEQVVVPATGHSEVVDYAVAPTCQRTGLTEGKHCLSCKTVIVEQKTVPKTAHYIVAIAAVEATCTKSGKTAGECCAVCDLITTAPKTTLPLGHTVKSRLNEATLSKDGALETYCERCNKTISSTPIKQIKSISLSSSAYIYNGKAQTPSVTVTDVDGKKLIKNTDYTLTYSSGRKNPGVYKVKITFKGNYSGSKTYSFTIAPSKTTVTAKQSSSSIKLTWTASTGADGYRVYQYNEKTKKWAVLIKTTKATTYTFKSLSSGTAYKYSVKPYVKDGSVIWSDSTRITVTTKPETPTISSAESPSNKSVTIKWNKITGATGYVVYYATSKNGTYKKLASTKERSLTSTKLSRGKTYYIKMKAYIKTSDGYLYSGASNAKTVYVK